MADCVPQELTRPPLELSCSMEQVVPRVVLGVVRSVRLPSFEWRYLFWVRTDLRFEPPWGIPLENREVTNSSPRLLTYIAFRSYVSPMTFCN
jgi:hypothetical protein